MKMHELKKYWSYRPRPLHVLRRQRLPAASWVLMSLATIVLFGGLHLASSLNEDPTSFIIMMASLLGFVYLGCWAAKVWIELDQSR